MSHAIQGQDRARQRGVDREVRELTERVRHNSDHRHMTRCSLAPRPTDDWLALDSRRQ